MGDRVVAPPDGLEPSTNGLTASAFKGAFNPLKARCSTELSSRPRTIGRVNGGPFGIFPFLAAPYF